MTVHRHREFKGLMPRRNARLLPPGYAQKADNVQLWNGIIRPFNGRSFVNTPFNGAQSQTIYRYEDSGTGYWFNWPYHVNVERGAVANDTVNRIFFTQGSNGEPLKTGNDIGIPAAADGSLPASTYKMGVKAPATKPGLTKTASGSGDTETRYYVYTFVTGWGEEGAPSPPAEISSVEETGSTVEVDMSGESNPDSAYNVTKARVYRTLTGSEATDFAFVDEITWDFNTASNNKLNDTDNADDLGVALETYDFEEPPSDLEGLSALPNGILVGFSASEKQVYFSEPYFPYAWPSKYARAIKDTPVAMGVVGTMVVVATEWRPQIFRGIHPEEMTGMMLDQRQSCENIRSLVETPYGVGWASPDGPYFVRGPGQADLMFRHLFSKREWQALRPFTMFGAVFDGRWYLFYDSDGAGTYKALVLDPSEPDAALTEANMDATAAYADIPTDGLYIVIDGEIRKWNEDAENPETYIFRTRRVPDPKPNCKTALQVYGDFALTQFINVDQSVYEASITTVSDHNQAIADETEYHEATLGGSEMGLVALGGDEFIDPVPAYNTSVTVRVYGNGLLRHTVTVESEKPVRLPTGYRAHEWSVEVEGQIAVEEILLANSVSELQRA